MDQFCRFIWISFHEKVLFIEASAMLLFVRVLVIKAPIESIRQKLRRAPLIGKDGEHLEQLITSVRRAASAFPWASTCLTQALVAEALLIHCGYKAEIVMGIMKENHNIVGHAWVECDNRVVIGWREDIDRLSVIRGSELSTVKI